MLNMEEVVVASPHLVTVPWLVYISHGKKGKSHTFYCISEHRVYARTMPKMCRGNCQGASQGWMFMVGQGQKDYFLLNPFSMKKIQLPALPSSIDIGNLDSNNWILTSPPTDPSSVLIVFHHSYPYYLFCWLSDNKTWIHKNYKLDHKDERVESLVECNGKIYAHTNDNKMACIDLVLNPAVRYLEWHDVIPGAPLTRRDNGKLIESCGEVFLVYQGYAAYTRNVVTFVVFKMTFSDMKWVQVGSIGDRAFFLCSKKPASCVVTDESSLGVRRDSIYFIEDDDPTVYQFNMSDKSITVDQLRLHISTPWSSPHWILPSA